MYVDRIFPDDTPHREQEQQVVEEQYTLLEAVTLRRCASAGDVESAIADEGEGSDDAAEPVVLASQLTGECGHAESCIESAQSKACNMAELRRQFFEAPWGGASLEELAAAGSRPSLLARHLLATPARTSSEPQLPANDESGGAGLSVSGTSRQSTSPHVAEARRRAHSPLRESVSLKKHWFSTDEASSSSSSCGGAGGSGDAGDAPASMGPIASPQPGPPRPE
ncbi:hypothetical protein HPB50_010393 [Hyalomma asiaticum]|uniref:Uncharacterized protein n=1 Tax=Hyalomma asiaticum TaxID=266040 RepID=A0ACB7T474_HYAAI|nr:hypothetical protein HPB50_010393 [Hyalomma asiaticum]